MRPLRPIPTVVACAIAIATGISALATSAPATAEDTRSRIRLNGFQDMAVVEKHDRIFISRNGQSKSLLVTDLTGEPVGNIPGVAGNGALAVSADRSTLYVGGWETPSDPESTATIAEIDIPSLEVVDTHPLPSELAWVGTLGEVQEVPGCPWEMTTLGGLVFYATSCPGIGGDELHALDPETGDVTVLPIDVNTYSDLAVDPSTSTLFVAGGYTLSAYELTSITPPVLSLRTSRTVEDSGSEIPGSRADSCSMARLLSDITYVPGRDVVVNQGGWAYAASNLRLAPGYRCFEGKWEYFNDGEDLTTIAARSDGLVASGSVAYWDARIFQSGSTKALRWYNHERRAEENSLEFGRRKLYELSFDSVLSRRVGVLHVITPRPASHLTLSTPRDRYAAGERIIVRVRFRGPSIPDRRVRIEAGSDPDFSVITRWVKLDEEGRGRTALRMTDDDGRLLIEGLIVDQGDHVASPLLQLLRNR